MRAGRSPGVRSGPKFSGWYVDAVNGSAGAGFARAAPEHPHRARGRSGTDSTFLHTPLRLLSARRRGGSAMLPSVGAEHGVSGELQAGNPSGRLCPIRSGSEGSMPPSDGIPLQDRSRWSRKCPRVPRERSPSLGYVSNVLMVIPRSVSEAAVNPSGASLRTPDQ
jgi:hypothetical protein